MWQYHSTHWQFQAGYGIGIVSGYKDGQSMALSKYSPIIPAAEGYFDATYNHIGLEFVTIVDVFTVGLKIDL